MEYKVITGPASIQGSDAWLEYRRSRIGASDAPVLMGESPYKTPFQLYLEKSHDIKTPTTPAMNRGKELEPKALEWFNFRMAPPFFVPMVIESLRYEGLMASLDGMRTVDGNVEVCEIKCPGETDHLEAISGHIPKKYIAQLDHILLVSGAKFCWYVSFDGDQGVVLKYTGTLARDLTLLTKTEAFLACLSTKTPPPTSGKDASTIVDPEANELAKKYVEVCDEIEMLEKQRDLLKQDLLEFTDGDKTLIGPLTISRIERKGNIDYIKAIPRGIDLEQFRKPSIVTWKISMKNEESND